MTQTAEKHSSPLRPVPGIRQRLGLLGAVVGAVASILAVTVLTSQLQHQSAQLIADTGQLLARQLAAYATEPMVAGDRLRLQALLQQATTSRPVFAAQITDPDHHLVVRAGTDEATASNGIEASSPILLNNNTAGRVSVQMKPPSATGIGAAGLIGVVLATILGYAAGSTAGGRLQRDLASLQRRLATGRPAPVAPECREITNLFDLLKDLEIRPRKKTPAPVARTTRVIMAVTVSDLDELLERMSPTLLDTRLQALDRRLQVVADSPEAALIAHRQGRAVVFSGADTGLQALRAAGLLQQWLATDDAASMPGGLSIGIDCEEGEAAKDDNALRAICWQRTIDSAFELGTGEGEIRASRLFLTLEGVGDHATVTDIDGDRWRITALAAVLAADINRRIAQLTAGD